MRKMVIIICTICILLTACKVSNNTVSLTKEELNQYIKSYNIDSIATKSFRDCNVVLYRNENIVGYYLLSKDYNGDLVQQNVSGTEKSDAKFSLGGTSTGNNPFITVSILEENLCTEYSVLYIEYTDKTEVTLPLRKGQIIATNGKEWKKISLLNGIEELVLKELENRDI